MWRALFIAIPLGLFGTVEYAQTKMCQDLEAISNIFESQYAPLEWKYTFSGWDLQKELLRAKEEILSTPDITIKDYQLILSRFLKTTEDFHVMATFHSTESAKLPFGIKSINGQFYIVDINREAIKKSGIHVGDEVISFNGQPIKDAVADFKREIWGNGNSLSDQAMVEKFFTHRAGKVGHRVPQGEIILGIREGDGESLHHFEWIYTKEMIQEIPLHPRNPAHAAVKQLNRPYDTLKKAVFETSMLSPYDEVWGSQALGERYSIVPALGKKIWSSHPDSAFHAYLFETPDHRRYGYIRIARYAGDEEEFEEFKELIRRLEEESEALVIDQLNNPGGKFFYMFALLTVLSDTPLAMPSQRVTLQQKEIASALEILPKITDISDEKASEEFSLCGLKMTSEIANRFAAYFHFLIDQWNSGLAFTSPYPIWGLSYVPLDQEVHYTKPILLLINELDFSCGDFFPSILQDNKRATLLGARTGGAGGRVLKVEYPNIFGLNTFSYTGSIAYREDNTPIENLGVVPDIEYSLTVEDLKDNYTPYKEKILEVLTSMVK